MSRIRQLLSTRGERKLLIPFFTAGFPTVSATLDLIERAVASGADIIEIGMPFSDPLADGPDIQSSSQIALKQATDLKAIFRIVEQARSKHDIPIILMGYFNPLIAYGVDSFLRDAASAGVDGLIIPDLPVEESADFRSKAVKQDITNVFLVAPTSTENRVKLVDSVCTDFVYAVTVTGVTGVGQRFGSETDKYLKKLRSQLTRPFVAGFGVSDSMSARRLTRYSDGVVIGSALIRLIRAQPNRRSQLEVVGKFLSKIRKAI